MQTGLIIHSSSVVKEESKNEQFHLLNIWRPDFIALDLESPIGMQFVEPFSRQGRFYPMISNHNHIPSGLVIEYMKQCLVILDKCELIISVLDARPDYGIKLIDDLVIGLSGLVLPTIYIAAPASYFFSESPAHILYQKVDSFGMKVHRAFGFSNTETSISLLSDPRYTHAINDAIRKDEETQIHLQMLSPDVQMLQPLTILNRPIFIHGVSDYVNFRKHFIDGTVHPLAEQVIARARILRDKTSAWNDITCANMTTRKFMVGDPDVFIVEITGNIGKTVDGDYIKLPLFDVEKL